MTIIEIQDKIDHLAKQTDQEEIQKILDETWHKLQDLLNTHDQYKAAHAPDNPALRVQYSCPHCGLYNGGSPCESVQGEK